MWSTEMPSHSAMVRVGKMQRGSAVVELAVAVPLLLVAVIGLVDFGRASFQAVEVETAAVAGATYGLQGEEYAIDTDGIKNAALASLLETSDASDAEVESSRYCECEEGKTVDCSTTCSGAKPAMYVRVSVEDSFETLLTYPGVPKSIGLSRAVALRVE